MATPTGRSKAATRKAPADPKSAVPVRSAPAAAKPPATKPPAAKSPAARRTGPQGKTATVLDSQLAYQGHVFSVFTDTVIEPGATEPHTRDVIRHSGSVVILALDERSDAADPAVILIRQYRYAAGQFLLELPAGRIEPGEAPLAAAKREMIEETGFTARKWTLLTRYFASPGFLGEWMQIYLARDLRPGTAHPEADEHIQILPTPLSKAMELVASHKIHDGKTLIGLSLVHAARQAGRL